MLPKFLPISPMIENYTNMLRVIEVRLGVHSFYIIIILQYIIYFTPLKVSLSLSKDT